MTAKLDPTLLRACAAYLAHADVYIFREGWSDVDMLSPLAAPMVAQRGRRGQGGTPPAEECDREAERHMTAICSYASNLRAGGDSDIGTVRRVALAILDAAAVPRLRDWWCERLADFAEGSEP